MRRTLAVSVLVAVCGACTGQIDGDDRGGPATPGKPGDAPAGPGDPAAAHDFDTSPGLRRLGRTEYTNTVHDLLGVTIARDDQPKELIVDGHGLIAGAQKIGYDDSAVYLTLADRAAEEAAPRLLAEMACADATCSRTWAQKFLTRAFRGPPAAAVLDRYAAMLTAAGAGATPQDRMTTFLTAVLTSPQFLYRKEVGKPTSDARVRALDPYEVATRLSYLAWQSAPDAELLDAAARGALSQPAQRVAQLERLLKDRRAAGGLRAFVSDWMGLHDNNLSKKTPEVLAGTGADFPAVAQRGFDLLVDDVLSARETARVSDLLSVEHAFANAALAKVLGVTVAGDFQRVSLDPRQRRGLLTHPLVIGAHSKESGASPFPIGEFIYENVLCESVPPPPAMFPPVEDTTSDDQTLRQRLEAMTSVEPCVSCHVRIGPPGFAFLPFDPVGRYKNADAKGRPYDTKGQLVLSGVAQPIPFDGASELGATLAAHPSVQACVARRLFRWTYGRFESAADREAVKALEAAGAGAAVALMRKTVEAPAFAEARVR